MSSHQVIPEGYKQTEVGVIPEDWQSDQLGNYVEICSGESPSKFAFKLEGVPYFKVEQLNNHPFYADLTPYFIDTKKVISGGSVIFPKRGASILSNKIRVLKRDSFMDTNLMTLTCNADLDSKYLYNQLTYRGLDSVADTTSIPQINNKHIYPFYMPVPVIEEQTAIANALSDVDTLLSELEKLIAKKQAIKTATMQQLLTGKTRLPQFSAYTDGDKQGQTKGTKPSELGEIPEDWDIRNLGCLLEDNRIPSGLYKDKNLYGTGTAIIKLGDVFKNDSFNPDIVQRVKTTNIENKAYNVKIGDLIIALASVKLEGVGKVMIVKELSEPTVYDHNVALIRFKKNHNSNFMSFLFKSNYIRSLVASRATQVGTTFLKTSTILEFPILLPPPKEQTAIATILSDMDEEIQALQQRLSKTLQIKQGMMQELLTGKTRLPFDKVDMKLQGELDAN
ncbi:restriction endonuclease subunit S [Agarivorans albus]